MQAVWRGHLARKRSGNAIHAARLRLDDACARAPHTPERQLIALTSSCLHVIQSARSLEVEVCQLKYPITPAEDQIIKSDISGIVSHVLVL